DPPVTTATLPRIPSCTGRVEHVLFDLATMSCLRISVDDAGIAEVVIDRPPVNALGIADWHAIADTLRALGTDPKTRVVILAAEGRGWNAGVDIKELHA